LSSEAFSGAQKSDLLTLVTSDASGSYGIDGLLGIDRLVKTPGWIKAFDPSNWENKTKFDQGGKTLQKLYSKIRIVNSVGHPVNYQLFSKGYRPTNLVINGGPGFTGVAEYVTETMVLTTKDKRDSSSILVAYRNNPTLKSFLELTIEFDGDYKAGAQRRSYNLPGMLYVGNIPEEGAVAEDYIFRRTGNGIELTKFN
jgi:hypothetical protein